MPLDHASRGGAENLLGTNTANRQTPRLRVVVVIVGVGVAVGIEVQR